MRPLFAAADDSGLFLVKVDFSGADEIVASRKVVIQDYSIDPRFLGDKPLADAIEARVVKRNGLE